VSEAKLLVLLPTAGEGDPACELPLEVGKEYVLGRAPLSEENGVEVLAEGVSRRHLLLRVLRDAIEAEDMGSTYGTRRNGVPITSTRITDRPVVLCIGDAEIQITPPSRTGATELRTERVITTASLRRILVILCRDHVVPPAMRGAWVLTDMEISAILGGTPNAGTVGKDIKRIALTAGLETPSTREALIDWAVASREISAVDAAELDRFLLTERGLPPYEDRVRTFDRSTRLRRNLQQRRD
jgi:pSer/pThr/pTyr-binding forkhead associated (FHA) protein